MESIDFQLDEVLDSLSTLVTLKAQEKGLEVLFSLEKNVPYSLIGDPLRLGQVLTNLTNNAVKFTEKGEIIVSIRKLNTENEKVELEFSVKDTGIGLTEKQIGKLFQSFSQADSTTTRKFGGTGLGLTISKKLVEMMDGSIWVESEPDKGSSFIFTAIFGIGKNQKKQRLILSDDLKGKKVLIVDDNQMAREILESALKSFSLDVSMASSGSEGISMVEAADKEQPYDLIIMDWQMPEMNGIRTSEIIKKHPKLKKIPKIIMLTAYGREEIIEQAEEAQLDGFMVKPMNPSILFETIGEVFGEKIVTEKFGESSKGQQEILGLKKICGSKILLVDDNEINQEVASELLEQAGMCVTVASDGKEAVSKVTLSEFDCIFMDIQMPVMDGYEATQTIRKDGRFASLPIIAMTANAMQGDREKCVNAGMNDHVSKPINPKELMATLIKWISPREETREEVSFPAAKLLESKGNNDLPELPGIDIANGLARVGKNKKLYKKMLVKFYQDNKNIQSKITNVLGKGDLETAERLIHTIRGVAGTLGAKNLAETAEPIEVELGKKSNEIGKNLWDEFWNELDRIQEALKQFEPAEDSQNAGNQNYSGIKIPQSIIIRMKEDIQMGNYMELDSYFFEIKKIGPAGKELAEHLKDLADQFDDSGILNVLDNLQIN